MKILFKYDIHVRKKVSFLQDAEYAPLIMKKKKETSRVFYIKFGQEKFEHTLPTPYKESVWKKIKMFWSVQAVVKIANKSIRAMSCL